MTAAVLLDVNVLVAIAWPNHVHHAVASEWFVDRQPAEWATCPVTESGFVRISSNTKAIRDAVSPLAAIELLADLRKEPGHTFWSDSVSLVESDHVPRARLASYTQITDAHLLVMAREHGGQLATFDRGLSALAHPNETRDILLLPSIPQQS